jgi:hypothetical protein
MEARLEIVIAKHHEVAESLMDHFYEKNDEQGLEMLGEIIDYEFMALTVLNDLWVAKMAAKNERK